MRRTKESIKAPCGYSYYDRRKHHDVSAYPQIDCGYNCDTCGFNPEEHRRRLSDGRFDNVRGINTLFFKRREVNAQQN